MNKNIRIAIFASVIIVMMSALFMLNRNVVKGPVVSETGLQEEGAAVFLFDEMQYDFGMIKQSGGRVSHEFAREQFHLIF